MDKKTKNLKVTIIQSDLAWENKALNINHFDSIISDLEENTDLIILPEMFTTGFTMKPEKFAEEIDGETINWMRSTAKSKKAALTGSIIVSQSGSYYNRLIFSNSAGHISWYDKRHLFRMGNEHNNYCQGDSRMIADLKGWKICPLICYDLRFPVWSRNRNDYDILLYVANWPESRREVWVTLLIARAIENQCYVIGVNRVGKDGNDINYSGDSMIISPRGNVISETRAYSESVETVELSISDLTEFRQKFPVGMDADDFEISK